MSKKGGVGPGTKFHENSFCKVKKVEDIGMQTVIGFKTSTKTFIAEGFASHNSEYAYERPSVEFFLGWAKGAGVHLVLPEKCDLLKTLWLYPFEDSAPFRAKVVARRIELRQRLNEFSANEQNAHDQRMQLIGALENMNYIEKSWENSAREIAITGGAPQKR
jgi:hypothetical protein